MLKNVTEKVAYIKLIFIAKSTIIFFLFCWHCSYLSSLQFLMIFKTICGVRLNSKQKTKYSQLKIDSSNIVDGWLQTGDVAFMDDEGHLYIKDRAKFVYVYKAAIVRFLMTAFEIVKF